MPEILALYIHVLWSRPDRLSVAINTLNVSTSIILYLTHTFVTVLKFILRHFFVTFFNFYFIIIL